MYKTHQTAAFIITVSLNFYLKDDTIYVSDSQTLPAIHCIESDHSMVWYSDLSTKITKNWCGFLAATVLTFEVFS